MPNTQPTAVFYSFLILALSAAALVSGCHTPYQCVFIQGAALGTVQPPLPPEPGSTEVDPARQYVGGTYPPPPPEAVTLFPRPTPSQRIRHQPDDIATRQTAPARRTR